MDPEALIRELVQQLANDEFEAAQGSLDDYMYWRGRGGFAPRRPEVTFHAEGDVP